MMLKFKKREFGFSLLEVLVSVSILAIATATFTAGSTMMTNMVHQSNLKSKAILASQHVLDELRLVDPSTLPGSNTSDAPIDIVIENQTFQVIKTYCEVSAYCPPSTSNDTRHIKITVKFNNKNLYEVQTVFTSFE